MKLCPYDILSWLVDSDSLDGAFTPKLKVLSVIKGKPIAFSDPIFSELKRNNLGSLDLLVLEYDVLSFSFLLDLHSKLYLSLFIVIKLIVDFYLFSVELFVELYKLLHLFFQSVLLSFFDDFLCDDVFLNFFLSGLKWLNFLFKRVDIVKACSLDLL